MQEMRGFPSRWASLIGEPAILQPARSARVPPADQRLYVSRRDSGPPPSAMRPWTPGSCALEIHGRGTDLGHRRKACRRRGAGDHVRHPRGGPDAPRRQRGRGTARCRADRRGGQRPRGADPRRHQRGTSRHPGGTHRHRRHHTCPPARGYTLTLVVPVAAGSAGRAQSSPGMCEHVDGRLSRPTSRTPGQWEGPPCPNHRVHFPISPAFVS